MQELTFILGPTRPAAEIWEALGAAGLGIEASCTFPGVDGRTVRVVLADADVDAGRTTLLGAGFGPLDRQDVLIAEIENRPGKLGELARAVADAGAQLTTLYMATGDRVVVGADDLDKVREVIG